MKRIAILVLAVAIMLLTAIPVVAAPSDKESPANDNPNNLYLYEKDLDPDWNVVWDGAWGKYNYKLRGEVISGPFNGHGLVAGEDYTLVEYEGWPNVTVIGSCTADEDGNVHIAGSADLGSDGGEGGYKIWLVLSDDLDGDSFTAWNPSSYLFEHNVIPVV